MKFIYFVYPLSFDSLEHLVKQTFIGKSPSRLIHNFFLRKLRIKGLTIDIGSKKYNSYLNFIKKKNVNELSTGQKQRVVIISLFIDIIFNDKKIILLDEVTSNVDSEMEEIIFQELKKLQEIYNFTNKSKEPIIMFYDDTELNTRAVSDLKFIKAIDVPSQCEDKKKERLLDIFNTSVKEIPQFRVES